MRKTHTILLQVLGSVVAIGALVVSHSQPVLAAEPEVTIRDAAYAAKFVSQTPKDPITIEAGASETVILKFKNIGTATWQAGNHFISAYTMEPRDRASAFRGKSWLSTSQTGKMTGTVKPGETGTLTIDLAAPNKTGEYTEKFYLSAENHTWIKGGYFFLKINVTPKKTPVSVAPAVPAAPYKAHRFMLLPATVSAKGGDTVEVTVAWQNVGDKPWQGYTLLGSSPTVLAAGTPISLADELWKDQNTVFRRGTIVEPDEITRETFTFRAPSRAGTYTASFHLAVNDTSVADGDVNIPVTVTENAPNYVSEIALPPTPSAAPTETPPPPPLAEEPRIKVGIWKKPDSYVQFRSEEDDYQVYDGTTLVGVLPRTYLGVFKFANNEYQFKGGDLDFVTANYIRLMPVGNPRAVFTLPNMSRVIKWKGGSRNFNQYRGGMEYHLTDAGTMYVINDLLLEDYTAGIGETSNLDPMEFLKAQAVASRTYAYFIANHTDKHDERNFDVVATTGDQLYLGYVGETITPNFVAAVAATRGMMVTYEHNIVVTPYFGHSNGKTRSWTQVWGGTPKPWLVSVVAKYDKGLARYGHGVGMSQRDAALRAKKDGWDWEKLVKQYYTGVDVERIYN